VDRKCCRAQRGESASRFARGIAIARRSHVAPGNWFEAGKLYQTLARHFPDEIEIWQARLECARRQKHELHGKWVFQDALRLHPEWKQILEPYVMAPAAVEMAASTQVEGR